MGRGCADNEGNTEAGIEITDFDLQSRANQTCSLDNEGRLVGIGGSKDEDVILLIKLTEPLPPAIYG